MQDIIVGPFAITFGRDGVEFRTLQPTDHTTLTYTECYDLFRTLYLRRDEIYRSTHGEKTDEASTLSRENITYTVNNESYSIASWAPDREPS